MVFQVFIERQLIANPYIPRNFTLHISDAVFYNNSCHQSGAVHIIDVENTIGPNVTFHSNHAFAASGRGGGLTLYTEVWAVQQLYLAI